MSYVAPPTIGRFMGSDAFVRLIVGPIGSGKSSGSVVELLRRALQQAPGPDGIRRSRWAIIRNTYRQLKDTTRKTFEDWIPPGCGEWKEQDFTFQLRIKGVEADFLFRALDRPQDIKKLLSLEVTGAYINEAREIPKAIVDGIQGRVGRYPAKKDGGCTWSGLLMDTNPPHSSHWIPKIFDKERPEGFRIFKQPGGRAPGAENIENLPDGYYSRLCNGKDSEWVRVYVDGEYATGDVGSIYGEALDKLERRGGVSDFAHPSDGVFTSWDLGVSDSTAIFFWRIGENRLPELVDHYEASGKGLAHFFEEVEKRGYSYVKHWLPHDARARTLQTGVSTLDQFAERYGAGMVAIGPGLGIADGISAARWLLEQPIRIHSRCTEALETLRAYRYEWDEAAQVFSRVPLHNFASHTADAFRYLACVAKHSDLITRPEERPQPQGRKLLQDATIAELFAEHGVDI